MTRSSSSRPEDQLRPRGEPMTASPRSPTVREAIAGYDGASLVVVARLANLQAAIADLLQVAKELPPTTPKPIRDAVAAALGRL